MGYTNVAVSKGRRRAEGKQRGVQRQEQAERATGGGRCGGNEKKDKETKLDLIKRGEERLKRDDEEDAMPEKPSTELS